MSKVVRGVGNAVSKVVSGVGNAVKKVAKSPIGKALLIAAAVYFGGAALSGAFSGATTAAGTVATGLEGAMTGIGNAWTSLGTAASQAAGAITGAEGASFANAGNALSTGFGGGAATIGDAGQMLVNNVAPSALPVQTGVNPITQAAQRTFGVDPISGGQTVIEGATRAANAGTGLINKMMASPYAAPALITTGGQLIGGAMQGYGNQKIAEQQRQLEADARARYNNNIGGFSFRG